MTRNQPRVILVTGPSINNETIIFSPIRSFVTLSFPLSSPTFRQRAPYNKLAKNPFITRLDAFSPIPQFIPHAALIRKCCVHGGTRFPFFFFPLSLSFSRHQKLERAARLIIKNGRVIDRERERGYRKGVDERRHGKMCVQQCATSGKNRVKGVGVEGHVRVTATSQRATPWLVWKYAGCQARDVHPSVLIAKGETTSYRTPELLTLREKKLATKGLLEKKERKKRIKNCSFRRAIIHQSRELGYEIARNYLFYFFFFFFFRIREFRNRDRYPRFLRN